MKVMPGSLMLAVVLVASPSTAQPPGKDVRKKPGLNLAKIAAAEQVLTDFGCQIVVRVGDRKAPMPIREEAEMDPLFGQARLIKFPLKTSDASISRLLPKLSALPALNAIDLGQTKVTDRTVESIANLPALEALYLDHTGVTNNGLRHLARFKNLNWLDLSFSGVKADGMAEVGKLTGLNHLSIASLNLDNDDLQPLTALEKLRELDLSGNERLTESVFEQFTFAKDLEKLRLNRIRVGDKGLKTIGGFRKLTELSLTNAGITDAGLPALSECVELKKLDLGGNNIGNTGLKELVKFPSLTHLYVGWTRVTSVGLVDLARSKRLESLSVDGTLVDNTGMKALQKLPTIRWVYARRTDVTEDGAIALMNAVPGCQVFLGYGKTNSSQRVPGLGAPKTSSSGKP